MGLRVAKRPSTSKTHQISHALETQMIHPPQPSHKWNVTQRLINIWVVLNMTCKSEARFITSWYDSFQVYPQKFPGLTSHEGMQALLFSVIIEVHQASSNVICLRGSWELSTSTLSYKIHSVFALIVTFATLTITFSTSGIPTWHLANLKYILIERRKILVCNWQGVHATQFPLQRMWNSKTRESMIYSTNLRRKRRGHKIHLWENKDDWSVEMCIAYM